MPTVCASIETQSAVAHESGAATPPPAPVAARELPAQTPVPAGSFDLLKVAIGRATTADLFADAVDWLRAMETAADAAERDAEAERVKTIRAWPLVGRWLQRRVRRSPGGRGKTGGLYAAALAACRPPLGEDEADRLRWIGRIPDDELDRLIAAGVRSKQKLADIGRKEYDRHGKPTGRSADGRGVTDHQFPFAENVERHVGHDALDDLAAAVDALPDSDRRARSFFQWFLDPFRLVMTDGDDMNPKDVRDLFSSPVVAVCEQIADLKRSLGGLAEDAIGAKPW